MTDMSDESTWDWERVRTGYEQGISSRSLAAISGHKRSTIQSRAKAEKWEKPDGFRPPPGMLAELSEVAEKVAELAEDSDDMTVVTLALSDLAQHLTGDPAQAKLQLSQHKLFADSLSQYIKVKYTLPASGAAPVGIDWSIFTPDELAVLQPIFERAQARQRPENVTAFRKHVTT
jgi:hypothetical protein